MRPGKHGGNDYCARYDTIDVWRIDPDYRTRAICDFLRGQASRRLSLSTKLNAKQRNEKPMSECCGVDAQDKQQRTLLWTVLGLNGGMFFVEFIAGWLAQSSGLMADSLDMLADAMVYMVGLYAVGKAIQYKAKAALFNGSLQLVLAALILVDVVMRLVGGSEPQTQIMFWISLLALAVNLFCFILLSRYKTGDINMRASWICSRNDMIANVGVIISAALVVWLNSAIPDLVIGTIIALIIVQSSLKIVIESRLILKEGNKPKPSCCG